MEEEEGVAITATRAATPTLPPGGITLTRGSGSHLRLYAMNFCALLILGVGYVFLAEEGMSSSFTKDAIRTTNGNVEGTNSAISFVGKGSSSSSPPIPSFPSLAHTMGNLIISSAAGMLNRKVCMGWSWGEGAH